MTVTVITTSNTATANGVLTSFAFTFELLQAADLEVYVNNVLTAFGYIVEINENGTGGDVIFDDPPENGAALMFVRTVDITQETALPVEGNLPESTLETMADKLTMICQQLAEILSRAFTVPRSIAASFVMPNPLALNLLRWNAAADNIENVDPATLLAGLSPGAGNVIGPASSTARTLALWNAANGQLLKAGPAIGTTGQVLTSNGAGVDPSFQALPAGTPGFTSSNLTISPGTTSSVSHGLGAAPTQIWAMLVCTATNAGYAVNDVVTFALGSNNTASTDDGVFVLPTTTQLILIFGNGGIPVVHKTSFASTTIDPTKWKLRLFANL